MFGSSKKLIDIVLTFRLININGVCCLRLAKMAWFFPGDSFPMKFFGEPVTFSYFLIKYVLAVS